MSSVGVSTKDRSWFNFLPGQVLARKYEVLARVGARRSGEIYQLAEQSTGIERTAKFFAPTIDPRNRVAANCALKMHRLRHCPILVQYRTQETISVDGRDVTFVVSDSFQGEPLLKFLARQPGGRLSVFEGLHLLHSLAEGVEQLHDVREAHGDLDAANIIIRRKGLSFQAKLLDLSPTLGAQRDDLADDVVSLMHIFQQAVGGTKHFVQLPPAVKAMCCGFRRINMIERFPTARELKRHMETMVWR